MVFDFVTGQDLCTGTYFNNAIPVVRPPYSSPNVGAFQINVNIADRPPDRQAGIPNGHLVEHHLRLRENDVKLHVFDFFVPNPSADGRADCVLTCGTVIPEKLYIWFLCKWVLLFRHCKPEAIMNQAENSATRNEIN